MRKFLYMLARLLGDLNAVQRGTIIQRLARRYLLARSGSAINRIIK